VSDSAFNPKFDVVVNMRDPEPVQFTKDTYRLADESSSIDCGAFDFDVEVF